MFSGLTHSLCLYLLTAKLRALTECVQHVCMCALCVVEIMHRLAQATFAVRQSMLNYVLPWLYNMELVEPSLLGATAIAAITNSDSRLMTSTTTMIDNDNHLTASDSQPALLKGRGWGSPEATDMILNNLLYTTVTVSSVRFSMTVCVRPVSFAKLS